MYFEANIASLAVVSLWSVDTVEELDVKVESSRAPRSIGDSEPGIAHQDFTSRRH